MLLKYTTISWKLSAIIALLLVLAMLPMPYGYYTFLKIAVSGVAGYVCYQTAQTPYRGLWLWLCAAVGILYNPIIPIHLGREIWQLINLITTLFFAVMGWQSYKAAKSP